MLDYPALTAVATIIQEGSFERAALKLGITPSAISQRVRSLEDRMGSVLIVRGQPCKATELGRTLCAHYDKVRLLEADLSPALSLHAATADAPLTIKIAVNADSLSTWFIPAATAFAERAGICFEFVLDDEAYTAERLRSGEVLAAVTSASEPVQGCKTIELGEMDYLACASPAFMKRHFKRGVTTDSISLAPCLRFDRRDQLQARWATQALGIELDAPVHWVPSSLGFVDSTLSGLAWSMQPETLARPYLKSRKLVELKPQHRLKVKLFWTVTRIHAATLDALTNDVIKAAKAGLSS